MTESRCLNSCTCITYALWQVPLAQYYTELSKLPKSLLSVLSGPAYVFSDGVYYKLLDWQPPFWSVTEIQHLIGCDETDVCDHGRKNCGTNKCDCIDQWSAAPADSNSKVATCNVCSLSCAVLQTEVTGGNSCHCAFNKVHLIWIIGVPILLLGLAMVACNKHRASKMHAVDTEQGLLPVLEAGMSTGAASVAGEPVE